MPTLTDDDFQDLAQEADGGVKFAYHIDPVNGDDSIGGAKSWQSPIKTFSKAITLATGSFANKPVSMRFNGPVTSAFVDLQTTGLGPVKMKGIGRYASLTGLPSNNGPIIRANTACEFEDFRIISLAGADQFNLLIGDIGTSIQEVVMRRVRGVGTTDGVYFTGSGSVYDAFDCVITSQWDTFFNENSVIARFHRCCLQSTGPHQISADAHVQGAGQSVSGALTYLNDCRISFRATNSDTSRIAYGVHTQGGGIIELAATTLFCEVPDGTVVDCEADSGSEIRISSNSSVNLARSLASAGTITSYPSYSDIRSWLSRTPNPLSTMGNVPADMVENGGGFTPALNTVGGSVPSGSTPALNGQTITGAANYPFSQSISVSNFNATSWTKLVFTVKSNPSDADSAAILTIQLSNPGSGGDGLTILNGAAPVSPVTAADGAIVVNQANSSGLTCTVTLTARGMGVAEGTYFWELTPYISGAKAPWLGTGQFSVQPTVRVAAT